MRHPVADASLRDSLTYSQLEMLQELNNKGTIEDPALQEDQHRAMIYLESMLLAERMKDESNQDVWRPLYTMDGELLEDDRY